MDAQRTMEVNVKDVRVLIVEDNKDFADSMDKYLTEVGFQVSCAYDAERAIREFRKKTYHVVILDLKIPGTSGEELLKQLRHFDHDASVIVITAYPSIDSAVSTTKMQSHAYLTKPFDMERLVALMKEAVALRGIVTPPEREILTSVGERVRLARKVRDFTQGQLANRTGLSRSLISRIESGSAAPSIPSLYKIAVALNAPMGDFFSDVATVATQKE